MGRGIVSLKENCVFSVSLFSAYDRAAIKFRGVEADINFNIEGYEDDLKQVINLWIMFFLFDINAFIVFILS